MSPRIFFHATPHKIEALASIQIHWRTNWKLLTEPLFYLDLSCGGMDNGGAKGKEPIPTWTPSCQLSPPIQTDPAYLKLARPSPLTNASKTQVHNLTPPNTNPSTNKSSHAKLTNLRSLMHRLHNPAISLQLPPMSPLKNDTSHCVPISSTPHPTPSPLLSPTFDARPDQSPHSIGKQSTLTS